MSTITIPASEVKAGDVIDFGGLPFTVRSTDQHPTVPEVFNIWGSAHENSIYNHSAVHVSPDQPITVTRPDPDAELVEVMARAMGDRIEVHWRMDDFDQQTPADQENTRRDVRAALAAAREAGLL